MFDKLKKYLKFWNKKPSYHFKSSTYGGFRLDIDQYYAKPENREKLKQINNSSFPDMVKKNNAVSEPFKKKVTESEIQS